MIQQLSYKHQKTIACFLLCVLYVSIVLPSYGMLRHTPRPILYHGSNDRSVQRAQPVRNTAAVAAGSYHAPVIKKEQFNPASPGKQDIGGPGQPEMSSFRQQGANNLVNLFTGDFSYNIPLMDVGGYPINIFYNGGIGVEQEASWVGLGWNINPGNINRNMRGIPDDFNGEDMLVQRQQIKKNITWSANIAVDLELMGIKAVTGPTASIGGSLGIDINNYLGPALNLGFKGTTGFQVASHAGSEKTASSARVKAGINANLSSRYGLTFSPSFSLSASMSRGSNNISTGFTGSTSYNSRTGIKGLQISDQMSFSIGEGKKFKVGGGGNVYSTTISFAKPSYIPDLRMPVTDRAFTGHFQLGAAEFGVYPSAVDAEVSKVTSEIAKEDEEQKKPMVGYLYYERAAGNPNAIMDFTRYNDKEVTAKTTIISVPQYTYDVFSIQGEGTGGSVRAYRNDLGFVHDQVTASKDRNTSIGLDLTSNLGHIGGNFNQLKVKSVVGAWTKGNKLAGLASFQASKDTRENVYFRNPGESSVLDDNQFERIGGTDLVRFRLGGTGYNPTIEPVLERFSQNSSFTGIASVASTNVEPRKKRTQVISFLTALEASGTGLDKDIRIYNSHTVLNSANNLRYDSLSRISSYRKPHHISEIDVTESNGKRYVYGIPVYNITQQDFTFSVQNKEGDPDMVKIENAEEMTTESTLLRNSNRDGYVQTKTTPAYAHSFLLSGLLSADYVDIMQDGITDDDLGDAVKFNYTCIMDAVGTPALHAWRTPLSAGNKAHFNAGNRSEDKDDKGIVSYGERESWYTHSIESKTMIALFTLDNRFDSKGAENAFGGIRKSDSTMKRLKQIDLYSKADLKQNGLAKAKPVKTVSFWYNYTLCQGTPDNPDGLLKGKLTLDSIWFSYNGQRALKRDKYVFSYGTDTTSNPRYEPNGSDRWGNYKPRRMNPAGMKNSDYPYGVQDTLRKTETDQQAAAWSLKKVLLPSGGQIDIGYECDDYAFVQNRRAAAMMQVAGFGGDSLTVTNKLYRIAGRDILENNYAFIRLPRACKDTIEAFGRYLQGLSQLAFRLVVNMPKGPEYITAYATYEKHGLVDSTLMWVRIRKVDGMGALSLTALEYLRQRLPGQAFKGYDVSEETGLDKFVVMVKGMIKTAANAFTSPLKMIRVDEGAQTVDVSRSLVRLNDPDGYKYGGGHRVKSVSLKDNWHAMTGQYSSVYTQTYHYTTTEIFQGKRRTISSGVASYEPSVGGEENPFQAMEQVSDNLPMGPASYESIELPVLDAFFPAPGVGYSKVTVRSLPGVAYDTATHKPRSGIGRQVTEFYTAKDFPVQYASTSFDPASDKQAHEKSTAIFFYKYGLDARALSQGFLVATNDMHGKLKSQSSYSQNDDNTRIYYMENFYRNTGVRGLDEKFDFAAQGGAVSQGNMGIDIELMTDAREFSVTSSSLETQGQLDRFPLGFPFYLPFIWPVVGVSENTYRAVTTTKVISYHSMVDSVLVIDKGSQVSTKNLVFDSETGEVLVNRTNNEHDKPVYATSYPAYWAYSGMGPAYRNINATYTGITFLDGRITTSGFNHDVFESGDEIIIKSYSAPTEVCNLAQASGDVKKIWVFDTGKNNTALTTTTHDYIFIDAGGKPYTNSNVAFRIMRSGRRNMLDAQVAGFVSMASPVAVNGNVRKLLIDQQARVLNATAKEYREKWQTDQDVIKKVVYVYNYATCTSEEVISCTGVPEKGINPYQRGLVGSFRPYRSMVFYGNRAETSTAVLTNLPENGSLDGFASYWNFNTALNLVPDASSIKWVWNSQVTRVNAKGLELETKNALNIYTAAQYGYNKSLPVAIAGNARSTEMAYEGFEDKSYSSTLKNNETVICNTPHTGLSSMDNTTVISTDGADFNAHSGKYVLAVPQGVAAETQVGIRPSTAEDFTMRFGKDTAKSLVNPGGNRQFVIARPANVLTNTTPFNFSTVSPQVNISFYPADSFRTDGSRYHHYSIDWNCFINLTEAKVYTFKMEAISGNNNVVYAYQHYNLLSFKVFTLDGIEQTGGTLQHNQQQSDSAFMTYSQFLCPGIYQIKGNIEERYSGPVLTQNNYVWKCTNSSSPCYASVSKINNCISTTPVAPRDSMINPAFEMTPGKKMVFSAWVHEDCSNSSSGGPCYDSAFTGNEVRLQYSGSATKDTLRPSGPLIDGWQRYEAYFTPPAGATAATVSFVNKKSSGSIYFDDIRIHPFHANMKSYVYDPVSLRLVAELDENNYASFYEYDPEGTLVRTKAETSQGIKTITETRSAKQKIVTQIQE